MATRTWYSVRLLFVSDIHGDLNRDRLCEESLIVVQETSEDRARQAAHQIALGMDHEYKNEEGELVQWRFVGILEVQDLCEEKLKSGTEVYSRLFYESQAVHPEVLRVLHTPASSRQ